MKRLEELRPVAERQLGGLTANPALLAKIKLAAAAGHSVRKRPVWQPILAACAALLFCVGAVGAALWGGATPISDPDNHVIDSYSAGDDKPTTAPALKGDVPVGSVSMSAGGRASANTLFESGDGSSFPLVRVSGATYRMLTSPDGVSQSLLGDALGSVSEFTMEPALGTGDIVSNTVEVGKPVYAVSGMNGALLAAEVGGTTRVFQRVSYAGTAIIGGESLRDTLCGSATATSLTWDGVGTVTDADTVAALMDALLGGADYAGTAMSGKGSLQIGLSNGLTLQLLADDDTVSACGTWSCPDFFEAFHEAVGQ